MKNKFLLLLLAFPFFLSAQQNVRAWYAQGQVWVVWEVSFPLPDWYSIYVRPTAFNSTTNAILVGRLPRLEYGCAALKEQIDTSTTPRIPGPGGIGKYQLAENEGLFVLTPHQAGTLFFAVVADDETAVNNGQNITSAAVPFQYDPVNDPVQCHLQTTFPSPFAPGFACFAFMMWADGRQNQWDSRPDFPIMANAPKNGMPSLFFVSVPVDLDTTQPFPLSVWLHGGGGTARQSLAGSRAEIDIRPEAGVLLTHDDNLMGWRIQTPPALDMPTWHFGWRKNYNPFEPDNEPTEVDTIVNYTQRRYWWIDSWLIDHFNIDPTRIHIHGHSMGSAGATALIKCNPEHYASATIFNNGFDGPEPMSSVVVFGEPTLNYPTNLVNRAGETVHLTNLFNLLDNCAPVRDWPLIRHWHSKNDDNGVMRWDAYVVENYRKTDSLGIGVQHMWSERGHGPDTGPDYNDHWISGIPASQQTAVDNVDFPEMRFRSDQSFPAFFNHRLDPQNNDPGFGLIGINNGDGDNWGAWGGYHRWDSDNVADQVGGWSVVAWLESEAVFANDNSPENSLTADLAIRRPRQFQPATGTLLDWQVRETNTGNILQSGQTTVQPDDLVVIPQVTVFRENIRRVRIIVTDPAVVTEGPEDGFSSMRIMPNPASDFAELIFDNQGVVEEVAIRVIPVSGQIFSWNAPCQAGRNRIPLRVTEQLPAGVYFIEISAGGRRNVVRWVKM